MPFIRDCFDSWAAANRAAIAATRAAAVKAMLALEQRGEPPSRDETEEARRLRAVADALFQRGMAAMAAAR